MTISTKSVETNRFYPVVTTRDIHPGLSVDYKHTVAIELDGAKHTYTYNDRTPEYKRLVRTVRLINVASVVVSGAAFHCRKAAVGASLLNHKRQNRRCTALAGAIASPLFRYAVAPRLRLALLNAPVNLPSKFVLGFSAQYLHAAATGVLAALIGQAMGNKVCLIQAAQGSLAGEAAVLGKFVGFFLGGRHLLGRLLRQNRHAGAAGARLDE